MLDDELRYDELDEEPLFALDEVLFVVVVALLDERLDDEPPRCADVEPPIFVVLLPDDTVVEVVVPRLVVPP